MLTGEQKSCLPLSPAQSIRAAGAGRQPCGPLPALKQETGPGQEMPSSGLGVAVVTSGIPADEVVVFGALALSMCTVWVCGSALAHLWSGGSLMISERCRGQDP